MNRPSLLRRRGDDGLLRSVLAIVGACALVLGLVAAFVPVAADTVVGTVGVVVGSPVMVVLVTLAGGLYGLFHLYRTGSAEPSKNPLVGLHPERAHYGEHAVSGAEIDESVDAVGGELPESDAKDWWTYREKSDVQSTLETVSIRVLASEHDVSEDAAQRLVDAGEWTQDPRAAAFLGEDAPDLPLKLQFVDWLSGEAYQRRVEATVDEIARHAGVGRTDEDAGRTAADSALPIHETSEAERIAAAAGEAAGEAASDDAVDDPARATSMADVRLDAASVTDGSATDGRASANGTDAADEARSGERGTSSGGEGRERPVEVAAERGGEDS